MAPPLLLNCQCEQTNGGRGGGVSQQIFYVRQILFNQLLYCQRQETTHLYSKYIFEQK